MEIVFPFFSFLLTYRTIPLVSNKFLSAGLCGVDVNKENRPSIPEGLGVVAGAIYLYTLMVQMPFPFIQSSMALSGMLSICCMLLLGFCDDVLELRWIFKLVLPTFASFPLLVSYIAAGGATNVVIPTVLKQLFGNSVDLGILYYIYMIGLTLFCTNSINIFAGINGIEVGQSIVIASSILVYNGIQIFFEVNDTHSLEHCVISTFFLLPFLVISSALFMHNKYPAKVFVGDSFCYFAGMVFSCAGILGHFGKTLLLFLLPQILNFLYSVPQLFGIFPCPRHRLPMLNTETNLLEPSTFRIVRLNPSEDEISNTHHTHDWQLQLLMFLSRMKLVKIVKIQKDHEKLVFQIANLTLINAFLCIFGPMHEKKLLTSLLLFQVLCSFFALAVRFWASYILF
jgi:UDP-N-acetylglucosamine--dolichyl-phosphate N-acetylglucosaminephosphotransferase